MNRFWCENVLTKKVSFGSDQVLRRGVLPSAHLPFREIGVELLLSANTVKTQAASTRRVARSHELGC